MLCTDIKECESPSLNECDHNVGGCTELPGSFRCFCRDGAVLSNIDGKTCSSKCTLHNTQMWSKPQNDINTKYHVLT